MKEIEFKDLAAISRTFYGDDENNKPDEDCFYDDAAFMPGWYETDRSLRKRVLASMSNKL